MVDVRPDRVRRRGAVATTYLVCFMAMIDVNIVVVGLPAIQRDLGMSTSGGQWIMSSYALCLATLAISTGALGDRFGRKRILLTGIALLTVGSLACALAPNATVILTGRVIQGVGAACALPGALSVLAQLFPEPAERSRAIAGYMTMVAIAGLLGPTLGGVLIDTVGWPWLFAINLPFGVAALVLGGASITESADPAHASLDPAGQVLAVITLACLSLGLIHAGEHSWSDAGTLGPMAVAVVGAVAFVRVERRQSHPMLPMELFAARRFTLSIVSAATVGFTAFSIVTLLPSYLQLGQGHSAAVVGLMLLPSAVVGLLVPTLAGRWVNRSGSDPATTAGLLLIAVAALILLAERAHSPYVITAAAVILLGTGSTLALTSETAATITAVPRERSGLASALSNSARQTGLTLGVAVLGSLLAGQIRSGRDNTDGYTAGLHHLAIAAAIAAGLCAGALLLHALRGDRAAVAAGSDVDPVRRNSMVRRVRLTVREDPSRNRREH